MQGIRRTRGMFTMIPENLLEDSGECYYYNIAGYVEEDSRECWRRSRGMLRKIPGNVEEDSEECWRRFLGMFQKILGMFKKIPGNAQGDTVGMYKKIPGNVRKDSGEFSRRFRGMFKKIRGNLNLDLFYEILLIF